MGGGVERRAQYDARAGKSGARQEDVLINISLKEVATGCTRLAHVGQVERCVLCRGVGAVCPVCPDCKGSTYRCSPFPPAGQRDPPKITLVFCRVR
jgi:DnaJ-class molecular chaperone